MKKLFTTYVLILICFFSFGQTEKLINPADLKQQTVVTEPLSIQKGFLRIGLFYSYSAVDRYFDTSGEKNYMPESTWGTTSSTQLWIQYGVTDRFMVEFGIPYTNDLKNYHWKIYAPGINTMVTSNLSSRGRGLGDMILSATYQIIASGNNNFSLKASNDLTLPSGQKNPKNVISSYEFDSPTGYGVIVVTPRITARYISYPFSYLGYVSYSYNFKGEKIISPTDKAETEFKYGNNLYLGGSINFHLNEWIALTNDFSYSFTGKGEINGIPGSSMNKSWAISYEPRVVFQIRRFRLGEAVHIPLKGKRVGADPLYVLMTQYVF